MFKEKGFSLVELLLVVAIAAGIFVFVAPLSLNLYRTQLIEESRSNIVDALQRARHYAVLQKNDSAFGVHFDAETNEYILFQGSTYDDRDESQDEVFSLIEDITFTGETDIIFSKLTGLTATTSTTTLIYSNFFRGILVEASGGISRVDTVAVVEEEITAFSPADVAGLKIWLKADALVGLNDGDSVTTWTDSSSDNRDATCGSCPIYKTNILNTEPVVRFDGSSNVMNFTDISDTRTVFVVFNDAGSNDYAHLLGGVTSPGNITFHGHEVGSGVVIGETWAHPNVNNGEAWVNGVSTSPTSIPRNGSHQILSLITAGDVNTSGIAYDQGMARFWNGDFAELIIYNAALSETDRVSVENYLSDKYGI
jgi:prepilin-type N-terminal cleavage/methylation domain-containing protein